MIDFTKIEVHTMQLSDLEEIQDCLQTDFDDFWTFEIFKGELVNTTSSYLVLRYEGEIVCFGGIKIILDEANIMDIVTKKEKRNQGFARILLNELITIAKEENCSTMTLEVREHNLPAIHLYEQFDFQEVGRRKHYYRNGDTAILMTLEFINL